MTTTLPLRPVEHTGSAAALRRPLTRRLVRGRPADPAWVRPLLLAVLALTAVAYLWDLGASGWANSFYAAAVQAGTHSWKAFLFGSSDASNFITVDKPPASLWVMELSARIFGLSSWSLLAPQAVEGLAAVALTYMAVRRAASAGAGLLAAAVLALTPVAELMFRFDNPDALLVLVLVAAAYATTRYLDDGRVRWLLAAGALVGIGFITKSLQAFVVVPVLGAVVLAVSALPLRRRVRDLALATGALVAAGGWWVAIVELTPAADRPYIGGSQDNSLFNLVLGYNGLGRLTGNESGSVGGGGGGGSAWGPTGLTRMFNGAFGGQVGWLLPAALALLVVGLVVTARRPRPDRTRAGLLLWGGWLVLTGLVFSLSKGIIHPYYTVALAPAIAALVGIGTALAWSRRADWRARATLAAVVAGTVVWSFLLLDRTPAWHPWLRWSVLVVGLVAAVDLVVTARRSPRLHAGAAGLALAACLAGPLAYTAATSVTPHGGAIPSAGPAVAGSFGPGGGGAGRGLFGRSFSGHGFPGQSFPGRSGAGRVATAPGGLVPPAGFASPGSLGAPAGALPGAGRSFGGVAGRLGAGARFGGGAAGGLLGSSKPSAAVVKLLESGHSSYSWVAATTGSESASGYQLATGDPVMSIGGFNGTDPAPGLAAFEADVAAGRIHWYIAGSLGGPSSARSTDDATRIRTWVEAHFTARTVGGVTLYDLDPSGS